jgi:PAS fold
MSDHIEQILGYPTSHFIGNAVRSYGSIIHLEDRPYVIDGIDAVLAANRPFDDVEEYGIAKLFDELVAELRMTA